MRFTFLFDGSLSTPGFPEAFSPGAARAELSYQINGGSVFRAVEVDSDKGDVGHISSIDPISGSFVAGTGSIAGSGIFGSTIHGGFGDTDQAIAYGVPFDVKVGLQAWVTGNGEASFLSTAAIAGVAFYDSNHNPVTNFSLSSASGTDYTAALAPVPEPSSPILFGAALVAMALGTGRARRESRPRAAASNTHK